MRTPQNTRPLSDRPIYLQTNVLTRRDRRADRHLASCQRTMYDVQGMLTIKVCVTPWNTVIRVLHDLSVLHVVMIFFLHF